jgi:hypothetical protein
MQMIDVVWSAHCDDVYVAKRHTTLLPPWCDCTDNAESAVNTICRDFFRPDIWEEWIGLDDSDWTVQVEIHSPPSIAGLYEVELERVTEARSRRLKSKAA